MPVLAASSILGARPALAPVRRRALVSTALGAGVVAALLAVAPAFAQTTNWTGATDTDWGNALNWDNGAPAAGLDVRVTNNVNTPAIVAGADGSPLGSLFIAGGGAVSYGAGGLSTVTGLTTVGDGVTNGTLTLSRAFAATGGLSVGAGSTLAVALGGGVTGAITTRGTMTVTTGGTVQSTTIDGGTTTLTNGNMGTVFVNTGGTFAWNGGNVTVALVGGGGSILNGAARTNTAALTINSPTTLNTGTFAFRQSGALTLSGLLTVEGGGSFDLDVNPTGTGGIALNGSSLAAIGSRTLGGPVQVVGNSTIFTPNAGTLTLTGGLSSNTATNLQISGTGGASTLSIGANSTITGVGSQVTLAANAILTLQSGVVFTAPRFTVNGTVNVGTNASLRGSANTMNIAGLVNVANGGNLIDATSINVQLPGGTIDFAGNGDLVAPTITIAGGRTVNLNGAAGQIVRIVGDVTGLGTIAITNGGTLRAGGGTPDPFPATTGTGNQTIDTAIQGGGVLASIIDNDGRVLTLSGVVSGTSQFTFSGSGQTILNGANTYVGATVVSSGSRVNIRNATALGTNAAGTTVSAGATLEIQGGINVAGEALTLNGGGVGGNGALRNISGANNWGGAITLGAASRINSDAGELTISGAISGAGQALTVGGSGDTVISGAIGTGTGTLLKDGSGILVLSGANTFSGATTVNGGRLRLQGGSALSNTALVTVNNPGILSVEASETVGNLGGNGRIEIATGQILTAGDAGNSEFSGQIVGDGGLTKQGAGRLTLSGANTYTGTTTINAGELRIGNGGTTGTLGTGSVGVSLGGTLAFDRTDPAATPFTVANVFTGTGTINQVGTGTTILSGASGAFAGTTNVNAGILRVNGTLGTAASVLNVNNGGTLQGTGTIGGNVNVLNGGTLAPGASPGTLTINGDLSLAAGSNTTFELNLAGNGVVGGTNNDLISVGGNLAVTAGAILNVGPAVSGYYRLFNVTGTGAATASNFTVNAPVGSTANLYTVAATPNQVNLLLSNGGQLVQFWDGADAVGNGIVNGGTGNWTLGNSNWTSTPGAQINDTWRGQVGIFGGVAGTVTVAGTQNFQGLQFITDGYTLNGGTLNATGDGPGGTPAFSFLNVDGGTVATINSVISGAAGVGIRKIGGGTLSLGGVNTFTGQLQVLAGTANILATGSVAGGVLNNATFGNAGVVNGGVTNTGTFNTSNTVNGGLTSSGTTNASGAINGIIANSGAFNVTGALAGNAAFNNTGAGTLAVTGGSFTGITVLTNSSSNAAGVNVAAGQTLGAGSIANTGSFASLGTVTTATGFTNSGIANMAGALNGPVINTNQFNVTGNLVAGGPITNNAGSAFRVTGGDLTGVTTFTNASGASVTIDAARRLSTGSFVNVGNLINNGTLQTSSPASLTNSGVLANNGSIIAAALNNSGTINFGPNATMTTGNASNTGVINMVNGSTSNLLTVNGALTGAGTIGVDVDLLARSSDRIVITGAGSTASQTLNLNLLNPTVIGTTDIAIITGGTGATFTGQRADGLRPTTTAPSPFAGGGGQLIAQSGLVNQWFGETSPGSGRFVIRSDLNPTAITGLVGSVSGVISAISAFNEPASAFVGGPADPDPNKVAFGAWARTRGGQFDIRSRSSVLDTSTAVSRSLGSKMSTDFFGFQAGFDMGIYNINNTGTSVNIGLHAGKLDANSKTPDTQVKLEQPFFGAYMAVQGGSFTFDALIRRDTLDMKVTNPVAGLSGAKLKGDGWSGLLSGSYRFNITDRIYIDPSMALLYSRADLGSLSTPFGVTLRWKPIESLMVRAGLQIGTFFQPTETTIIAPFGAVSVWHELAGDTSATATLGNLSFISRTNRLETFGQVSLGMAATSTTPGLSGFIRGDMRFGGRIEGYALNGGLRYQF